MAVRWTVEVRPVNLSNRDVRIVGTRTDDVTGEVYSKDLEGKYDPTGKDAGQSAAAHAKNLQEHYDREKAEAAPANEFLAEASSNITAALNTRTRVGDVAMLEGSITPTRSFLGRIVDRVTGRGEVA